MSKKRKTFYKHPESNQYGDSYRITKYTSSGAWPELLTGRSKKYSLILSLESTHRKVQEMQYNSVPGIYPQEGPRNTGQFCPCNLPTGRFKKFSTILSLESTHRKVQEIQYNSVLGIYPQEDPRNAVQFCPWNLPTWRSDQEILYNCVLEICHSIYLTDWG